MKVFIDVELISEPVKHRALDITYRSLVSLLSTFPLMPWPINFYFVPSLTVLPEYPVVLNRWGRPLNGTILGPKEEVIS